MISRFTIITSLLCCLVVFTLTGCSTPPTNPPSPTPAVIQVVFTPALRPLGEAMHTCAVAHPEIALFVDEVPASALDSVQADLVFRLGEPVTSPAEGQEEKVGVDTGTAISLAWDEIVVILHPENNASIADLDVLQGLFSGQITRWDELGGPENPVHVWIYPEGEEARQFFDAAIMGKARNTSLAGIAPDPAAMLEAVSTDPDAIGYLPLSWITEETPLLRIDKGFSPGLRQPLLALSGQEPEGAALIILNCLQGEDGQAIVQSRYQTLEK